MGSAGWALSWQLTGASAAVLWLVVCTCGLTLDTLMPTVVDRWDNTSLPCQLQVCPEVQTFKEVGVFHQHCPFFWVGEEAIGPWKRKMPISASYVALIRNNSLPSQHFKDFCVLDLLGPDPRKTIPVAAMIKDLIMHYIPKILPCSLEKKSFTYYWEDFKSSCSKAYFKNIVCTKRERLTVLIYCSCIFPYISCWKLGTRP